MRNYFILFILCLFCSFSTAQDFNIEKISPALWEQMMDANDDHFPVYILMEDQVDVLGMRAAFNRDKTSLEERAQLLIPALMEKASVTQKPILDYLTAQPGLDTEKIAALWITNVIQAELTIAQINALTLRREVGKLEWIPPATAFSPEVSEAAPVSPNGSEIGHRSIKADKLWAMGYSGYGRRIMIQDSGVEGVHPALRLNYQGYHVAQQSYAYTGSNPSGPNDCAINGIHHGTHVAGTTCGLNRLNNDTIGVAHNAKWLAAPHANLTGACDEARWGEIQNYQWALNPDGNSNTITDMPDVINNSFGGVGGCQNTSAVANSQDALETAGVAVVWAAGNDGPGTSTTSTASDINHDLVISFSVAALNSNATTAAGFSSRGPSDCGNTGSLMIKPEVAAPGVNVRSSNGAFGYTNSSGTSMAAPHVAGSVALLKEAFPDLTGEEIKLALYFSANDLGAAGEDNTYGMGIINLLDAFNYLVADGNTPTVPQRNDDVMIVNIEPFDQECGDGSFGAEVLLENGGENTLTSAVVNYEFIQNGNAVASGAVNWSGSLETHERSTIMIPDTEDLNGTYIFRVTIDTPNGTVDERPLNNIYQVPVRAIQVTPLEVGVAGTEINDPCMSSSTVLRFTSPEVIDANWYVTPVGGAVVNTGTYYETPPLPNPFTFYAVPVLSGNGGIQDIETTETASGVIQGQGLKFDVLEDIHLYTTKVYAITTGPLLVRIVRANGGTLKNKTVTVNTLGEVEIDWDIDIPAGSGYTIQFTVGAELRYTTNPDFPYTVGGALSIIGSTEFADPLDKYLYFYDWAFEYNYSCGRIPIEVNFSGTDGPTVAFMASTDTPATEQEISFTNTSTNATQYSWNFGDGTTSMDENPTHVYTEVGTYPVTLSASSDDGCTVTTLQEIRVALATSTEDEILAESFNLFPNPSTGQLTLLFTNEMPVISNITVIDLLGQSVLQLTASQITGNDIQMDLSGLTNGVYHLLIETNEARTTRRVIKMN